MRGRRGCSRGTRWRTTSPGSAGRPSSPPSPLLISPAWALVVLGVGAAAIAADLARPDGRRPTAPHEPDSRAAARSPPRVRLIAADAPLRSATLTTTLAFAALGGLSFALVAATEASRAAPRRRRHRPDRQRRRRARRLARHDPPAAVRPPGARRAGSRSPRSACVLLAMSAGSWPVLLGGAFLLGVVDGPLLVGLFATRSDRSPPGAAGDGLHGRRQRQARRRVRRRAPRRACCSTAGRRAPGSPSSAPSTSPAAAIGWLSLRSAPAPAPGTSPSRRRQAARP